MRDGVVIVGGGPAGSVTALRLAQRGIGVTVVERTRFPRRKVCGEYLNVGTTKLLERIGLWDRVAAVGVPLEGIRLVTPWCDPVALAFREPALALERLTFDALLLEAAMRAGARVVYARAEDVLFRFGRASGVVVRDGAGERHQLWGRYVVGADGAGSLVARRLRLAKRARGPRRFALGGHYRGCGTLHRYVEMYVGREGYLALNPLDEQRVNVMLIVRESWLQTCASTVDDGMEKAAAALSRGHRVLQQAARDGPRACAGPLSFRVRGCVGAGALLVGDAAGFLDPFTGQGVYLAVSGAIAAADTLAGALAATENEPLLFARYDRERNAEFSLRARLGRLAGALTSVPFLTRRAAAKLERVPRCADGLVAALSGSSPPAAAFAPAQFVRLLL